MPKTNRGNAMVCDQKQIILLKWMSYLKQKKNRNLTDQIKAIKLKPEKIPRKGKKYEGSW